LLGEFLAAEDDGRLALEPVHKVRRPGQMGCETLMATPH
jgi:hypothetical protein